jgi:hypothetical protein
MLDDAATIIGEHAKAPKKQEKTSSVKMVTAVVKGNYNARVAGEKLDFPEATSLKVSVEMDQMSSGYGGRIQFWDSAQCTTLFSQIDIPYGDMTPKDLIIPVGTCYYTATSQSWYIGCPPINILLKIREVLATSQADAEVIKGTVDTALAFLEISMKTKQEIPQSILITLAKCLSRIDTATVQPICRTMIRLFNNFNLVVPSKDKKDEELASLRKYLTIFERCHSALRTSLLVNWNLGGSPGPLLQVLLELVLSGHAALGTSEASSDKNIPSWIMDSYTKYRDGKANIQFIGINQRKLMPSLDLVAMDSSNYAANNECYVADVCVRGGKFYYEVCVFNLLFFRSFLFFADLLICFSSFFLCCNCRSRWPLSLIMLVSALSLATSVLNPVTAILVTIVKENPGA